MSLASLREVSSVECSICGHNKLKFKYKYYDDIGGPPSRYALVCVSCDLTPGDLPESVASA